MIGKLAAVKAAMAGGWRAVLSDHKIGAAAKRFSARDDRADTFLFFAVLRAANLTLFLARRNRGVVFAKWHGNSHRLQLQPKTLEQPDTYFAIVAIDDNFDFRASCANPSNYLAYFDVDADGHITIADNFFFRSLFHKLLSWRV